MHSNKNYSTILDYLGLCHTYAAVLFAFRFMSDLAIKTASCSPAMSIERKIRLASDYAAIHDN